MHEGSPLSAGLDCPTPFISVVGTPEAIQQIVGALRALFPTVSAVAVGARRQRRRLWLKPPRAVVGGQAAHRRKLREISHPARSNGVRESATPA